MLSGNQKYGKKTWFYNFADEDRGWTPGPDLNEGRHYHAWGVITDLADENRKVVVVAGGGKSIGSQSPKWTIAQPLPYNIRGAAGVVTPDGKSFLLVGGWNVDTEQFEDTIYLFQCHNLKCYWAKLNTKHDVARDRLLVAFVPESVLASLWKSEPRSSSKANSD